MRFLVMAAMAVGVLAGPAGAVGASQDSGQDPGQTLLDEMQEYDVPAGDDGSIDACGPAPEAIPAGALEAEVRRRGSAALDHANCILEHTGAANQRLLAFADRAGALQGLTPELEEALVVQINRINGRLETVSDWSRVYLLWSVRPVIQDANARLGLPDDPLAPLLD